MAATRLILWSLLLVASVTITMSAPETCVKNERPLVIALLALHSGSECNQVVQSGAQQMAALELELDRLNSGSSNLKFDLKVMDTCSSREEAVKAGLRALVYIEQSCTKPPLFLGFLGPEDPASLKAVSRVSGLFQYSHVVPSAVRSYGQFNAMNVEVIDPAVKAKNLKLLLTDLNWASFLLVHTSDSAMTQTAASLIESGDLCVLQSVLQIPSSTTNADGSMAFNRLLHALQQVADARVVVLADTAASAEALLRFLDGVATNAKFLVYVQGSGMLPWPLSQRLAEATHIVQETTKADKVPTDFLPYLENSTLWTTFRRQFTPHDSCLESCKDSGIVPDSSILPLVHALHLYAHGLKTLHTTRCGGKSGGMCHKMTTVTADEWKAVLEGSVTFNVGHKVRFYMESDDYADVFVYNSTGLFENVATINNGKYSVLRNTEGLFVADEETRQQCEKDAYRLATEPPPVEPEPTEESSTTTSPAGEDRDILGLIFTHAHIGYWEMVAILIGVACGIFLFILVVTCIVYRSVRVKPKKQFSEASSTSDHEGSPRRTPRTKTKKTKTKRGSVRSNSS